MDKYHIHVYMIQGLAEVNIDACDPVQAKEVALSQINKLSFSKSDCNYIAIAYKEEDENHI